jgi:alanine racemase
MQLPTNTSFLELSQSALGQNIAFLRKLIGTTMLSAVVKGNAYGHGIEQFVPMLEREGVHHFSVFSSNEAMRVWKCAQQPATILIMGWIADDELTWAISNEIHFFVFDKNRLEAACESARKLNKKARIHIEVETGMNRTGFEAETCEEIIAYIKSNSDFLSLEGLCTHYAGAESVANYMRVKSQITQFNQLNECFTAHGLAPKIRHTACSAATLSFPETHMDMVRIGILLYGFWPNQETYIYHLKKNGIMPEDPLKRVIAWKTQIMSIKRLKVGEFIGYGTSYQAPKNLSIATVPVGYSYGFTRNLSNLGRVLVKGRRVGVIGLVNMNLMIINISDVPNAAKGDEVVLIGNQQNKSITVASFGELSNQLNYELLSRLPVDIPRKLVK